MRTRIVRVRRRGRGMGWAIGLLIISMALYIRTALPAIDRAREDAKKGTQVGARTTEEIRVEPICVYLVSFGGYDVMNSAKVEAARYVSRGAAGYVYKKDRLYVIGAGYGKKEEAERACVYLAAEEGMVCAVLEAGSPEVVMRLTAGERQIDAFVKAEEALRDTAELFGLLAFAVDRGETTLSQAQEAVRSERERGVKALEELKAQKGETENGLWGGLEMLLTDLCAQADEMMKETKRMGLSSRLKYCHVDMTVREIEWLNALIR